MSGFTVGQEHIARHTPVVRDHIRQLITEASAARRVRGNYHVTLIGPHLVVPAGTPGISP
jgi:predicted transcriptional regulator